MDGESGSGSGSGSGASSRAPSRPRSPNVNGNGEAGASVVAETERGRQARRRSVEEVLGVAAEVTGAGNSVGLKSPRGGGQGELPSAAERDVDMDAAGSSARPPARQVEEAEQAQNGLALDIRPPASSSVSSVASAPMPIPVPASQSATLGNASASMSTSQAGGTVTNQASSSCASSSIPSSSRSSTRSTALVNGVRRGSNASAISGSSRRSGRSSAHGRAASGGSSAGRTPSLSVSAGSAGRPAGTVLDTRHAAVSPAPAHGFGTGQGVGVRTPDVLGKSRESAAGRLERAMGTVDERAPASELLQATPQHATDGASNSAHGPSTADATSPPPQASVPIHEQPHSHGHATHLPSGGKLLKNLVGVFKKRPAHPHVPNAASPEQPRRAAVPVPVPVSSTASGRPAKSPRIAHSHTSPSMSPTALSMPTRTVNVNVSLSPSLASGRGGPASVSASAHARARTRSNSKSQSPRNSPFLAPAIPGGRGSGAVYGVRRGEGDGGLAA